jgi:hypothetical protein
VSVVADLRVMYGDEASFTRMTSSAPPLLRTVEQTRSGAWDVIEEIDSSDAIGQNLSAALVGLIGGIIGTHDAQRCSDCTKNPLLAEQTTAYSPRHPLRRAMTGWERKCHREHRPPMWRDHRNRPICADMLRLVIVEGASTRYAAESVGISHPRAERLLMSGCQYLVRSLREEEARLLGINKAAHGIDCPAPATCPVCSEDYSPSLEAKAI